MLHDFIIIDIFVNQMFGITRPTSGSSVDEFLMISKIPVYSAKHTANSKCVRSTKFSPTMKNLLLWKPPNPIRSAESMIARQATSSYLVIFLWKKKKNRQVVKKKQMHQMLLTMVSLVFDIDEQ